jgi:ATP-dependent Lon protease
LSNQHSLSADQLRWQIDESTLAFASTAEVSPVRGVVGQPIALEAMRFGVECEAPGQNVYVRGVSGTGRMTLIRSLLEELEPKARRSLDRCYVHNFQHPDRPRLLSLQQGQGPLLRRHMKRLAEFIQTRLGEALDSAPRKSQREAIHDRTERELKRITGPLEQELHANGMTLVQVKAGPATQTAIFPVVDGKPVSPEEYRHLSKKDKVSKADVARFEHNIEQYSKRLMEVSEAASMAWQTGMRQLQELAENETRQILKMLTRSILEEIPGDAVATFIDEVIEDVVENRLHPQGGGNMPDPEILYGVNVICSQEDTGTGPIIIENSPTVANLLGSVEPEFVTDGRAVSNYRGVRAGSLVHADGGFIILDAHDVLSEPGSWRLLMRALRTGCVEIVPSELAWPYSTQSLKPEPIEISVRVILIGSSGLYHQLDYLDQDFANLFKVLVDFDSEMERTDETIFQYAAVLARLCNDEKLLHFSSGGVAAMLEHGARIASRHGQVTTRFGRLADIARESAFLAGKSGSRFVKREHVAETIKRNKLRASLPSKRFKALINDGTIRVETTGEVVGQINGLAVMHTGPLSFGFPARITATVGAGRAGVINIEGAASLSGSIHTKGFHILGGLLRHLIRADHPLAFSASIAFEQSYGGIDGDSASGAEFCCLLSAIADVPIRQSLAMTGAIDQLGHIQAIGGVNEKIEGYFDACISQGLSENHGVIIPSANAGDLMLRNDVVEACREGRFHVYAVSDICEALEVLTGMTAGTADEDGVYPRGTLLACVHERITRFWKKTLNHPAQQAENGEPS